MSSCCLPPGRVLTRTERAAIARLREQRAQGKIPSATAHIATQPRPDPVVSLNRHPTPRKPRKPLLHHGILKTNFHHHPTLPASKSSPAISTLTKPSPAHHPRNPRRPADIASEPMSTPALLASLRDLPIWHKLRRRDNTPGLSAETPASGAEKASSSRGLRKLRDGETPPRERRRKQRDNENASSSRGLRRKWGDVVDRFGAASAANRFVPSSPRGERFVLRERNGRGKGQVGEESEPGESFVDDRYFQELMTGQSEAGRRERRRVVGESDPGESIVDDRYFQEIMIGQS